MAQSTDAMGAGASTDLNGRTPLTEDQVASFAALGLDALALRVYELALLLDDWTPVQMCEWLGVDADGLGSAIESLTAKGLLTPSQEIADVLRAVNPRVGLSRLIEERDRTLRMALERLSQTRAATQKLIEVVDEHDTRQRSSLEQVTGRDRVTDRVSEILRQATSEVLTMLTMLPSPDAMARARRGDAALLERGVHTRMLVLIGHVRRCREYVGYLEELVELGAEVRVVATLPTRMVLVDELAAIVPSDPDEPGAGATIIRHHSLIRLMRDTFESLWNDGRLLGDNDDCPDGHEPNELQLEVIRLLGRGNKDEAIARRVGMSLRSVRRLISQISQDLGSNSRFELGVVCSARGWVKPTERR
ncbi:MAG: hypothetical protein CSA84_00085 [Actinomycetales bacterium]|nr:MAG: hypothetical protein CSA84_00085 [Actinomycetales bacterium]